MARLWTHIAFLCRVARPGAALGSVVAAILFAAAIALTLRSGLGTSRDILVGVVLAALALAVGGSRRDRPPVRAADVAGALRRRTPCSLRVSLRPPGRSLRRGSRCQPSIRRDAHPAQRGTGRSRRPGRASDERYRPRPPGDRVGVSRRDLRRVDRSGRVAVEPGTDPYVALQPPPNVPAIPSFPAGDPSRPGPHAVRSLYYGSGTDQRRPEYGSQVSLRTVPVDASPLVKHLKGVKAKLCDPDLQGGVLAGARPSGASARTCSTGMRWPGWPSADTGTGEPMWSARSSCGCWRGSSTGISSRSSAMPAPHRLPWRVRRGRARHREDEGTRAPRSASVYRLPDDPSRGSLVDL